MNCNTQWVRYRKVVNPFYMPNYLTKSTGVSRWIKGISTVCFLLLSWVE